jgi:hypothetical protein
MAYPDGYEYQSASNPPIPRLSGVPYLCRYVGEEMPRTPAAPQGPSDEELNRVPPDPMLPPFGGNNLAATIFSGGMIAVAMGGSTPDHSRVMVSRMERRKY